VGKLVLTRNIGEEIVIGEEDIIITVKDINGRQARIEIDADDRIPVNRKEVYDRIQREKDG